MLPLGFQLRSPQFWDHRGPRNDALISVVHHTATRKVLLLLQKSDFYFFFQSGQVSGFCVSVNVLINTLLLHTT